MQIGSRDRTARIGVAGAYLVQGLCFAAVLTQVPAIQDDFGFTDGQLTLILLVVPVLAGVGSVLAGTLAPRRGSAVVLRAAGPTVCLAMALIGYAPDRAVLLPAIALFGLALGAVDASMNMQGVAVQQRYGRSILASFHGVWSIGGIGGSLANAGAARLHLGLGPTLTTLGGVGLLLALYAGPRLYRHREVTAPAAGRPAGGTPAIPWRPIVLIGLAVMIMYIADSATSNWSAKYLADALHSGPAVAPLGLAAYLTCQVLGRLVADHPVRRFGPTRPVATGGLIGVAGLALVAAAPGPALAVAGFAVVGFGLCVVVPQSFSAAGALDPTGSGVAVSRVNLFNYVGFVVGAGLIGEVDQMAGLRWAFAVPAALCLAIAGLAPAFRAGTTRDLPEAGQPVVVAPPSSPVGQ